MSDQAAEYEPVSVKVSNLHELAGGQPGGPKVHCRAYTVVLTSTNPVETILDLDNKRLYALVQAGGNDAVINNSKAEIQNGANEVAGLPDPIGMVLPYGNTSPTKIPGGEHWYATAAAYPTQITVLVVQEAD